MTDANRVLAKAPRVGFSAPDTALIAAELSAPELAMLPPFECPFSIAGGRLGAHEFHNSLLIAP